MCEEVIKCDSCRRELKHSFIRDYETNKRYCITCLEQIEVARLRQRKDAADEKE